MRSCFWLHKKGLGTERFFSVTFAVLDTLIERQRKSVKITVGHTLDLAVLKSPKKQSIFRERQFCPAKTIN